MLKDDEKTIEKIKGDKAKTREWTISIAAIPGSSAEEIAEKSEVVRKYERMRVGDSTELEEAGFRVESDGPGKTHGVLHLPGPPTPEMLRQLHDLMPVETNLHYEGR